MPKPNIRIATIDDSQSLAEINLRGWQVAYKGIIPDSYLSELSVDKRTKTWEELFNDKKIMTRIFVAEIDNKIIGFCNVGENRDEDMNKTLVGELWGIYMDPDFYGQGVGSTLMKKGLEFLKKEGYKKAILWTLTNNSKTRKWYEKRGWRAEGKTKSEPRKDFDLNEIRYIIDL